MRTTLLASMLVILASTAFPVRAADVYRLGPEDVVVVTVLRHEEFSGEFLVPADGVVELPSIGKVTVTGKTLTELADYIREHLRGRLRNPEVAVTLKTQREQRVYVLGSVDKPGVYDYKPGWRITESIASAGGVKGEVADCVAVLMRTTTGEKQRVKLPDVLKGDPTANLPVQPGDVISVETVQMLPIYVTGQVKTPGMYPLRENGGILEAIALAGGALDTSALNRVTLTHVNGESETLDLASTIQGGKHEVNPKLQPGDLVVVPEMLPTYVMGQVKTPGPYLLRENGSILEAIALAGGALDTSALNRVTLTHVNGESETLDLASTIQDGTHEVNRKLQPGDLVVVPESKSRIAVLGYVNKPGYFTLKEGEQIRLSDAIGLANGTVPKVACLDPVLVLRTENGKQDRMMCDLGKFLTTGNASGNPVIRPGDVVYVSKSRNTDWNSVIQTVATLSVTSSILGLLK